jgi:hypothetical protein
VQRAVLGVLIVLLAGCSTGGQASPADPPTTEEAAPTTVSLPPRPRDVPVDDVDPCSLLTRQQRAELRLDQPPLPDREPSVLYPGEVSSCTISGDDPAISFYIQAVTTAGIEFFTTGQTASEVRIIELARFPAAVAAPVHTDDSCKVLVDIAPGQMLDVQARSAGEDPPIPEDQLCSDAQSAANLVMDTLLNQR